MQEQQAIHFLKEIPLIKVCSISSVGNEGKAFHA